MSLSPSLDEGDANEIRVWGSEGSAGGGIDAVVYRSVSNCCL